MQPIAKKPTHIKFVDSDYSDRKALTPNPTMIRSQDEFPSDFVSQTSFESLASENFLSIPEANELKKSKSLRKNEVSNEFIRRLDGKSDIERLLDSQSRKTISQTQKIIESKPITQTSLKNSQQPENASLDSHEQYLIDQQTFNIEIKLFEEKLKIGHTKPQNAIKNKEYSAKVGEPKRQFGISISSENDFNKVSKRSLSANIKKKIRKTQIYEDVLKFDKKEYDQYTQVALTDTSTFANKIMKLIKKP